MSNVKRITFENSQGEQLAAALELPDRPPRAFALFAHCFTCGKDSAAAARIARTLSSRGIAVMRFDFTGLGGSQGDFANTNFSANVADLLSASAWLRSNHQAPAILIGHSLGGTAVLAVAKEIEEVKAVVTIGAPASPDHILKQLDTVRETIVTDGEAEVSLAGRVFNIKRQFIEDVRAYPIRDRLAEMKRALLILHAPFDETVSVDQASEIFLAAKHPKSFVSLDGADHLLTDLADAQYVANTISTWATRYISEGAREVGPEVPGGEVLVSEGNLRFLREVSSDDHAWVADEPKKVGGDNLGPDPYEHLLAALGTCTSMTIRMYANHKGWPLENVLVQLEHDREHAQDCEDCEGDEAVRVDVLSRAIRLEGPLDRAQRERLMEIADRCPVHRTLEGELRIDTVQWT